MKQILFTLLILTTIGLMSCRKNRNDIDIKQYDQQQMDAYIAANGLTGMQRDTTGGDTSGIRYKIITPGKGAQVDYPDDISAVYTEKSFDGKYIAADTVLNHFDGVLGNISPNGLLLGIRNLLKYKGGKIRLLVPSHLAFGINGKGQGSSSNTSGRIAGNQCLDYTINLIDKQDVYDDMVIQNYISTNTLTGYTKTASGLYYSITTPGTGTGPITGNSTITCNYTGRLLNGTVFDSNTATGGATLDAINLIDGAFEGLKHATAGSVISMLIPSALGYGKVGASGTGATIPANACLRFEFTVLTVTN
ncbi:MAG TPA: FKBP-type peptidyl-prolyl cis-trans isomerase [Mucilaginibacter sp.]|nr:FKBP-type peptidyl-prolyl cis-trans isomerase [Mucilaginibacter sp.]